MEPESSYLHLQRLATCPYSIPFYHFFKIHFYISSHLRLGLTSGLFLSGFPTINIFFQILDLNFSIIIPYPTAFPYGNGMVLHFYQQQESSTTKTVHKVINKWLKAYV